AGCTVRTDALLTSPFALRRLTRSSPFPCTTLFRSHPAHPAAPTPRRPLEILREATPVLVCTEAHLRPPTPLRTATPGRPRPNARSEEHTSELQSREKLVCRLLLEKKKNKSSLTFWT